MEGFCRGCLIKYDEPMELLQYTEKNRRLFVYSTGLQVKRNDSFTFQLCKDCYLNMKQACKFKKNCRTSDKRFRNYIALKDVGDPVDFCTFLKNSDDTLTFRFPMASGNSTPANQKSRDDDNESTCTSIRNFMTDILQGEEMPDTEARIIKEVIEEEADVLDDSLDSHWLQDDMSIDTDFRLDFSFSQFSTPRTVNDDRCYTPKQKEDQITFETINTEKQTKILNDFTNAFKTDDNIEELSIFVGGSSIEKTGRFENLKEFSPLGIDEIDGIEKSGIGIPKSNENLKENLNDFHIDEMESMDTLDNKTGETEQNMKEFCNLDRQQEIFGGHDEIHGNKVRAVKMNKSLKELISNLDIEGMGKSDSKDAKTNQILKELVGIIGKNAIDVFEKPDSEGPINNRNLKELCDFSLDSFSGGEKAESKALKNVKSLKELCDSSLDSFEDTVKSGSNTFKNNENVKDLCDLSLNDFDDIVNSVSLKNNRKLKESCHFGISEIDKSESNLDLPSLPDIIEEDKIDTPDFDIPKGLIGSVQSNNDISKSSINIEALLQDKPCSIDKNLEEALKNSDNKEFSLEDLLVSSPVFPAASAASTPTITNILFGENMDTTDTNTKIEQCLEAYHNVQTDIEIFEEFFKNDTKEFDLDDFNREYKSEDWKKPDADTDFKVADKENDLENIKIPVEGKDLSGINNDKVIKKSVRKLKKTNSMIQIPQDDINDKFNIDYLYCKLCKIRYDTSRAFSVHLSKKHNIKVVKPRKPTRKKSKHEVIKTKMEATINISDTPATDKFDFVNSYCKLCDIKYDTNRALSIHFAKTHHIKIEKPKSVKKERSHELLCNNCGDKSKDRPSFVRHVKQCGKKAMTFTCDRCKLDFATQPHLDKHMTCHTKMKKKKETGKEFVCTICGTIIHRQCNFILHMRRHTKDYSARCDYCDKGFYRQSDLKAHMRGHTGDTHFSCKFCPKLFTRKDVLLRHILIHLDERLYVCDYCSKRFIKKYDLVKHIKNYSCRKLLKNERKAVTNEMTVDIPKNQEERVENRKKEAQQEVINDVTVIYTKGSHDTIMKQLPFLETERSN